MKPTSPNTAPTRRGDECCIRIIDRVVLSDLPEKLIASFLLPRIRNLVNQAVEFRTHNLAAMQDPHLLRWHEYPDFTEDELEYPRPKGSDKF